MNETIRRWSEAEEDYQEAERKGADNGEGNGDGGELDVAEMANKDAGHGVGPVHAHYCDDCRASNFPQLHGLPPEHAPQLPKARHRRVVLFPAPRWPVVVELLMIQRCLYQWFVHVFGRKKGDKNWTKKYSLASGVSSYTIYINSWFSLDIRIVAIWHDKLGQIMIVYNYILCPCKDNWYTITKFIVVYEL